MEYFHNTFKLMQFVPWEVSPMCNKDKEHQRETIKVFFQYWYHIR